MKAYVNRALGFVLITKKVADYPFICLALTMRCACCGALKPVLSTTIGVN